jgi:hypothetical protein
MLAMETFIVRVWVEDGGGAVTPQEGSAHPSETSPRLRGTVQHVQSGTEAPFTSASELTVFLVEARDAPRARPEAIVPD